MVSNPPLADIAPPTFAWSIDVEENDAIEDVSWKNGVYTM